MADFRKLDEKFRLTPWSIKQHADFVASVYGSMLSEPERAEAYVRGYEKAESEADETFKKQQEMLSQSSISAGGESQKLVKEEKIDWDPRKLYAPKKTDEEIAAEKAAKEAEKAAKEAAKEAAKAEKKAQKEAEKAAKKAAKEAANA